MGDLLKVTEFYNSAPVVEVLGRAYCSPAVESEKVTDIQVSLKERDMEMERRRETESGRDLSSRNQHIN